MSVVTSFDQLNFGRLLGHFGTARRVTVVTYSFELRADNPLRTALESIPENSDLLIIACIPSCDMTFEREGHNGALQISSYYRALNPRRFRCRAEVFLSHHNHAKFILCDNGSDRAGYVGSANFTMGSAKHFEAGYLLHDERDILRLDEFAHEIRARAIPYFRIGSSVPIQKMLQFAADSGWLCEQTRSHSTVEKEVYKDVWEPEFSLDRFGIPPRVVNSIEAAVVAAAQIEQKLAEGKSLADAEDAIVDSGVLGEIEELLENAKSLNRRDQLTAEISRERAEAMLIGKYSNYEEPAENEEFREEAAALAEQNRTERLSQAEDQLNEFIESLRTVGETILSALRV
jgi:hypothetical protein